MRSFLFFFIIAMLSFLSPAVYGQADSSRGSGGGHAAAAAIGSITGKLTDGSNSPVPYATVTLLRADSSVVNGDLSKDDGSFTISPTGTGSFILRVTSLEIATKYIAVTISPDAPDKDLGKVKLAESAGTLQEVSVVGERPIMELKVDKKVFNVDKNTTTAGGSATDVLQNVPSVSVDADGTVSLRGKSGVTILIDGKPSTLLGTDVQSALQSLPAGSIESVEVITNPSAKYDAQGTTGIINIITKKDGRLGINGNITLGAGTRDKYNGNLGLNVRKGKWNAFLNSSFRLNSSYNNVTTDRIDKMPDITTGLLQSYHTYEHVPRNFNGNFNTVGVTYDADKYNSITLTENINIMDFSFKDNSDYFTYNNNSETSPYYMHQNRYTTASGGPFSASTALDYQRKFRKKGEELSVDATFAYTTIHRDNNITTTGDSAGQPYSTNFYPILENAPGHGDNKTLNVWADYTDPLFTKNGKLGLGFKSQLYWFNSVNNPAIDSAARPFATDYGLLAAYNYNQQIHAAYINWSDQVGKFSYQLGLRVEDAVYDGEGRVPNDTTFKNNFLDLFPSAFISYQLPAQQSIYLSYTRRTNRPGFMQLLPFRDISNPGTVNIGNPGLIPEFINNIEFNYSKSDNRGDNFILSAYYAYTQNLTERVTLPITSEAGAALGLTPYVGELYAQPVNIASGTTYGLEGTGHIQILPIWDATINANLFQNELKVNRTDTQLTSNSGFTWFAKINTNIKLPKNFSFQINANYESPKIITQGTLKDTYWIDLALRKNFWKNKATLIINCSDVFNTHRFITSYNLPYYAETINRFKETRIGNITFTYRFGKSDFGSKGAATSKRSKGTDDSKQVKPADQDRSKNLKEGDEGDNSGSGGAPGGGNSGGQGGGQRKGG